MALTWGDVGFAAVFNCLISAILVVVFCFLRRSTFFYDFYNAKRRLAIPFKYVLQSLPMPLRSSPFPHGCR
jgi:hypothetical protein